MVSSLTYLVLGAVAGLIFLVILHRPIWGVLALVIVSLLNASLEEVLPIQADRVVGLIVLIVFIARLALMQRGWKSSVLNLPVMVLAVAGLVTLIAQAFMESPYLGETIGQVLSLLIILAMSLVIVQILETPKAVSSTLQVLVMTTVAISLVGIVAFVIGIPAFHIGNLEVQLLGSWGGIGTRVGGIYEQPNTFAIPLLLSFPLCLLFTLVSRKALGRFFWMAVAGVILSGLLLSQSRSAILGTLLGVLFASLLLVRSVKSNKLVRIVFVFLVVGGIVLSVSGMFKTIMDRFSFKYMLNVPVAQYRPVFWREAVLLALHNPFGHGAETKYLVGEAFGIERKSVHNIFFSFLSDFGFLGFVGILLLAFRLIRGLWSMARRTRDTDWGLLSVALISGLIAFWFHNLFHSMVHWMVVWIYFACAAAVLRLWRITTERRAE